MSETAIQASDATTEARLRRQARRQGLTVRKVRRNERDWRAPYLVIDAYNNTLISGEQGLDLYELEEFINPPED